MSEYTISSKPSPSSSSISPHKPDYPRTDLAGWRLQVSQDSHGQHKWVYLAEDDPRRQSWVQNEGTRYWLGLDLVSIPLDSALVHREQLDCVTEMGYIGPYSGASIDRAQDSLGSRQERVRVLQKAPE
jgi:hypothetical protein